jgi:hypothetical protein
LLIKKCSLHYWHIASKHTTLGKQAPWITCLEFQKNPSNGRRGTAEKVYCWSKVAFVIDRSQLNSHCLSGLRVDWSIWVSENSFEQQARNTREGTPFASNGSEV